MKQKRRIAIVIEDNGADRFKFYVEGDAERLGNTPKDQLSPAEYWATVFLGACYETLEKSEGLEVTSEFEKDAQVQKAKGELH